MTLATLALPPALRALQRVRADQWSNRAMTDLMLTVEQLGAHFSGRSDFPEVTLEVIESMQLLAPAQLRFLQDSRVTFIPFAGADPDRKVVIEVRSQKGFLPGSGGVAVTKGAITRSPD